MPRPAYGERHSRCRLSWSTSGGPRAVSWSTQKWEPCPPLQTQSRGEPFHTPLALLRLRQAGLLMPDVLTHIQPAAAGSTREWDPCTPFQAQPAPPSRSLRQAALLLLIHIRQAAGGSTQAWSPCPLLQAQPRGELLCTPRAQLRLRQAALLLLAVLLWQWAGPHHSGHSQEWIWSFGSLHLLCSSESIDRQRLGDSVPSRALPCAKRLGTLPTVAQHLLSSGI